jgi:exopolyphosphatase / guanosine-5'-triphosphate,3'-diphosphate pyrophosphatase
VTGSLYAAIDCGTNSTRLLISDGRDPRERLMRVTRLGAGVDRTGRLDPEAIERTLGVLREYRTVMDRHDVAGVRIAATSAARDAANRDELLRSRRGDPRGRPELLSGTEEAQLSFTGATHRARGPVGRLAGGRHRRRVDRVRARRRDAHGSISVDMGCVRMTEKYLHHDPPLPEELSNCLGEVEQHLDDVAREVPGAGHATRFIGLAGTVTTVAAVELGLIEYDRDAIHHFSLTRVGRRGRVPHPRDRGARRPRAQPRVGAGERADVIVGGCCALVGIFRYFGFDECLVSEADILDGLVLSQLP